MTVGTGSTTAGAAGSGSGSGLGSVRLTEWTSCGGCAAKWSPSQLSELVRAAAPAVTDPALLVGLAPFDDAAVYRISDDLALVSTTDFFPPLVDDPDDFGAIAAANAVSDVFAMGGRVALAVNIAVFPEGLGAPVIATILEAAASVVEAAGGSVAGGHTIRGDEPVFGLAVQGFVHPDRILTKAGARPGDRLVLSKPVGTGLVLAAGSAADRSAAVAGMRRLNRQPAEALTALGAAVHAVTDVTGFGLFGHGWELAERSGVRVVFAADAIPAYPGARAAAAAGTRTGGDARNRAYLAGHLDRSPAVPAADEALGFDPQTSGGLLAAVDRSVVADLVDVGFAVVGEVGSGPATVEVTAAG